MKYILGVVAVLAFPVVMFSQSLTGTVTGADTGSPISGATVLAIQKTASLATEPAILRAHTDKNGLYAIAAVEATFRLCVQGARFYLDPCQWGGAVTIAVAGSGATTVPLKLAKGNQFIVRVHDDKQLLRQAEAMHGQAVSATIVDASGNQFLLPMSYDDGRVRDYGAVVPVNIQMKAIVTSVGGLHLTDATGAALSLQGTSFKVMPEAATASAATTSFFKLPPGVTMIHVHASH